MQREILRAGDDSGNGMAVRYTSSAGVVFYGIGIPQSWSTRLGPTWSYVVEGDSLTLVDTGCNRSVSHLEQGLECIGYSLSDVGRVVVTHGHLDHDGSSWEVVARSGAELWAHEVYHSLAGAGRWEKESQALREFSDIRPPDDDGFVARVKEYEELGQRHRATNVVTDGLVSNGLSFFYTPGHSPDEVCVLYEKVLFSGDHILPQITPHPSVARSYVAVRGSLPRGYRLDNRCYGLSTYLRSLRKVAPLGEDIEVMPAHRAFHAGKFNPIGLGRTREIVEHHRDRCAELLELLKQKSMDLDALTRKYFSRLMLEGPTFYLAFSEVVSHVELLQEAGDVRIDTGALRLVHWQGSENFSNMIDAIWNGE